jgi:DNA-binding SARP family transcriptional activator
MCPTMMLVTITEVMVTVENPATIILGRISWPHDPPQTAERGLNPLISKLRRSLAPASLEGRSSLRLRLRDDAWVDVEAAEQGAHRAESRLALGQWGAAWGPALVALFVSERTFLPDEAGVWIDDRRAILAALRLRALEAYAAAALGLGRTELPAAVRAGRELVRLVPLRESGYQILMKALARQGNVAEGVAVYADLCRTLRDELGSLPAPPPRRCTASCSTHSPWVAKGLRKRASGRATSSRTLRAVMRATGSGRWWNPSASDGGDTCRGLQLGRVLGPRVGAALSAGRHRGAPDRGIWLQTGCKA